MSNTSNRPQLRTVTVVQATAEHLRGQILDGSYNSGDRLRDSRLAEELGVSRNTVRASCSILENEGLLIHRDNRGWAIPEFEHAEVEDVFFMRTAIARTAYSTLIERGITPTSDTDVLLNKILEVTEDIEWSDRLRLVDRLHENLVSLVGSRRLAKAYHANALEYRLARLQMRSWLAPIALRDFKLIHIQLVDCIRKRDRELLEDTLKSLYVTPWENGAGEVWMVDKA
ncbi:GntR family transcriptional regulator [Cedecea colo]|uniref:GntR family transcriptional regulator n=1 Tax=Cedecea colo TaxID=2552946 RepID=UPI00143056DB|nr:GntR family transcriptional regulator [Cedecea colo]